MRPPGGGGSLHKILFHFKALLWESIILVLPSPPAKSTLLQCYYTTIAQYTPAHRPPHVYAIHCTILVMAISCKGQESVLVLTERALIRAERNGPYSTKDLVRYRRTQVKRRRDIPKIPSGLCHFVTGCAAPCPLWQSWDQLAASPCPCVALCGSLID